MNKIFSHMDSEQLEQYKDNIFLKLDAEAYSDTGSHEALERLLIQMVIRITLGCVAPTPMIDIGELLFIAPLLDDEGRRWLPLYTDLEEALKAENQEFTCEISMRDLVEEAFERGDIEGIVINPYSDKVELDKRELDYVLDIIMRMEANENED